MLDLKNKKKHGEQKNKQGGLLFWCPLVRKNDDGGEYHLFNYIFVFYCDDDDDDDDDDEDDHDDDEDDDDDDGVMSTHLGSSQSTS